MTFKRICRGLSRQFHRNIIKIRNIDALLSADKYIFAAWYLSENWGDALNPYIISRISGKKVYHFQEVFHTFDHPVYSVVGSIIGAFQSRNMVIWGSGFISRDAHMSQAPRMITAVRGPRTRQKLIDLGFSCPPIYGDPALLMPRLFQPKPASRRYKLGIIPHYYKDRYNPLLKKYEDNDDILIIDICKGIEDVVTDICSCDIIASSSLHGLICADAYGIPNVWLEFSSTVLGHGFKFKDYFESIGRFGESPLIVTAETSSDEIMARVKDDRPDIDVTALWDACPFKVDFLD